LGEVHQTNEIVPICNSFIQLWATSNSLVQRWAIQKSSPKTSVRSEMSECVIRVLFKFEQIKIIWVYFNNTNEI